MKSQVLITPIDEIITYLKNHPQSSTAQIAMLFKIDEEIVDKWISILEEEGIVKIEFHGLEPEISYIDKKQTKKQISIDNLKDAFVQACYKKKVSNDKMKELWKLFFNQYEQDIKEQFKKESLERKLDKKMIPVAWQRFRKTMEEL